MPAPLPGRKVRGSETGRPIMALLDLIGRRWTLRIIWELWQAPAGFRALQARCDGMSPSVLSQRLSELEEGLLVAQDPARFYRPKYVGHKGWIGVRMEGDVPWEHVAELVRESYRLTAPKRLAAQLSVQS